MSERLTNKERREQRQQSKREAADKKAKLQNTRRLFLRTAVGLTSTALLASVGICTYNESQEGTTPSPYLTGGPQVQVNVGPVNVPAVLNNRGRFNSEELKNTLNALDDSKSSPEKRVGTVINNIATLITFPPSGGNGTGTGLMIDKSGYFLTAGHLLTEMHSNEPSQTYTQVHLPQQGRALVGTQFTLDIEHDLGIIFAPTGERSERVKDLTFLTEELVDRTDLWQFGMLMAFNPATLQIMHGTVNRNAYSIMSESFTELLRVEGMLPFGGSSGGPIVDIKGKIRAVESGFYVDSEEGFESRDFYKGSTVAPLTNLRSLVYSGEIHSFPVTRPRF